jgi:hypothetical protein
MLWESGAPVSTTRSGHAVYPSVCPTQPDALERRAVWSNNACKPRTRFPASIALSTTTLRSTFRTETLFSLGRASTKTIVGSYDPSFATNIQYQLG